MESMVSPHVQDGIRQIWRGPKNWEYLKEDKGSDRPLYNLPVDGA